MAEDAPVACAIHARKNGFLNKPVGDGSNSQLSKLVGTSQKPTKQESESISSSLSASVASKFPRDVWMLSDLTLW